MPALARYSDHYTPQVTRVLTELDDDIAYTTLRDDDPATAGPIAKRRPAVASGSSLLSAWVWQGYCRPTRAADVLLWKVGDEVCDMGGPSEDGYNTGDDGHGVAGCSCSGDPDRVLCAPRLFTCKVSEDLAPGYVGCRTQPPCVRAVPCVSI